MLEAEINSNNIYILLKNTEWQRDSKHAAKLILADKLRTQEEIFIIIPLLLTAKLLRNLSSDN